MALAGLGVAVIAAPASARAASPARPWRSPPAPAFALFSVTCAAARRSDGTPSLLIAALLAAAICAVLLRRSASLAISGRDLLACAVMGIVQIGCGLVAFTAGSRHLPAADLTLLAQTEVVLAPVWAWLVVGEPAFWTLVGGAMVQRCRCRRSPARGGRRLDAEEQEIEGGDDRIALGADVADRLAQLATGDRREPGNEDVEVPPFDPPAASAAIRWVASGRVRSWRDHAIAPGPGEVGLQQHNVRHRRRALRADWRRGQTASSRSRAASCSRIGLANEPCSSTNSL